MKKWM